MAESRSFKWKLQFILNYAETNKVFLTRMIKSYKTGRAENLTAVTMH